MKVKCLAQEHNIMSPARARTRTARFGDERTNHEANAPLTASEPEKKCRERREPEVISRRPGRRLHVWKLHQEMDSEQNRIGLSLLDCFDWFDNRTLSKIDVRFCLIAKFNRTIGVRLHFGSILFD